MWVQDAQQINGVDEAGCVPPALLFGGGENEWAEEGAELETAGRDSAIDSRPFASTFRFQSRPTCARHIQHPLTSRFSPMTPHIPPHVQTFRCPKQNWNRSSKQTNRLKYHMTHNLKTTAIMPTTVQAQASLVPTTTAHSRSGSCSGYQSPLMCPCAHRRCRLLLLGPRRLLHLPR